MDTSLAVEKAREAEHVAEKGAQQVRSFACSYHMKMPPVVAEYFR